MRHVLLWISLLVLGARADDPSAVESRPPGHGERPVVIDYFYEPGCPECLAIGEDTLPRLKERFEGLYVLNRHDITIRSNVVALIRYQETLGIHENEPVCMIVDGVHVLNGFAAIQAGLADRVDEQIARRLAAAVPPPAVPAESAAARAEGELLRRRLRRFTLPAVLAAGLGDGINPCAISTLVFFMSLLSVAKVGGRRLVLVGASFCVASFVTYTGLGFGLLRALHLSRVFPWLRLGLDVVMVAALIVLALLSFRDAFRYRRTGRAQDIALRLPRRLKETVHRLVHRGVGARNLVLGGLFIGITVTALESVCTGQVYVPTLVLVVKTGESTARGLGYLLLYNIMFVVPLVAVFVLSCWGMRLEALLRWSRREVVGSKVLLGVLFIGLAVLIVVF
ncbi:MAG: hypothetical protein JXR37_21140 [Kiritimatiellae bacterium]|nr:hypothetical protein [Kiritimatiellia bacterium]